MNNEFDYNTIRKDFPILEQTINNKPLIYVDNAATAQKPNHLIQEITKYYTTTNANVHRGIHTLSEQATDLYEKSRKTIAKFISAKYPQEIIFTSNATHALNTIAFGLALEQGDEIIISEAEHHANIVPWQELEQRKKIKVRFCKIKENGELDFNHFKSLFTNKTKVVSLTHCSNVLGIINPIKKYISYAKEKQCITIIDASQSICHTTINVQKLDCDFLVFSMHKLYGPTGVGVLYGKLQALEQLSPLLYGGGMIEKVSKEETTYGKIPDRFEAGTPNIQGIIATQATIEYLKNINIKQAFTYEEELTQYFNKEKQKLSKHFMFLGDVEEHKIPLFSFYHSKISANDIITFLDEFGIAARGGHHCAQILHQKYTISGTVRISLGIYNTKKEIDTIIQALHKIEKVFM